MSDSDRVRELIARLEKTQHLLQRIVSEYREFIEGDFVRMGEGGRTSLYSLTL